MSPRKVLLMFMLGIATLDCVAQLNLSGKPGLIYIPTARQSEDGEMHIGYFRNPQQYAVKYKGRYPHFSESVYSVNLAILPRLEVNLNLLAPNYKGNYRIEGIGDRQIELKYQVLQESERRPALAIFISPPFGRDVSVATNVLVATKNFKVTEKIGLEATVGYASPWYAYRSLENARDSSSIFGGFKIGNKNKEDSPYLSGPIAGAKLTYQRKFGVMLEWDSQRLNAGLYSTFFNVWTLQAGLIGFDAFTLGTSVRVPLKKTSRKSKKL